MNRWRAAADGPLLLLVLIGAAFVAALGTWTRWEIPSYDPFVACETVATTLVARLGALGGLLPVAVISVVLLAAGLALAHQVWATRRVLAGVLARRRPLDVRLARLARRAGIAGRLDLIDDAAAYTFCYGLARPRVCVSAGLVACLADDELAAVLRHEAHHLRHRDPLKIVVSRSVSSGLFFLPLAGALRNGFLAGKELCADAEACEPEGELALARALYKLLAVERPRWPAGILAVGALSPTEARLRRLLDPRAPRAILPSPAEWLASVALTAGIFGLSHGAVAATQAPPVHVACASPLVRPARESVRYEVNVLPAAIPALECDSRCRYGAVPAD